MIPQIASKLDSMAVFAEWISSNPNGGIIELEGIKIKVTPKNKTK